MPWLLPIQILLLVLWCLPVGAGLPWWLVFLPVLGFSVWLVVLTIIFSISFLAMAKGR